jgi:hypothetical protein
VNGQLCPQVEHALQTGAGQAVMSAASRGGAWIYAGMSGIRMGLDFDHVTARAARFAPAADAYHIDELTARLEAGALRGGADKADQVASQSKGQDFDLDAFIDGSKPQ